jgi:hypothetical protein
MPWNSLSSQLPPADIAFPVPRVITGAFTIDVDDGTVDPGTVYDWDVSGGSAALTLPSIVSAYGKGRWFVIRKSDSSTNTATITAHSGQTIGGASTLALTEPNETVLIINNGSSDWLVAAHNNGSEAINDPVWIARATVVSTTNITLSGHPTIHGVGVSNGSRVLATGQTTATERLLYEVLGPSDPWIVAPELPTGLTIPYGSLVYVDAGTDDTLDSVWKMVVGGGAVIGTDGFNWSEVKWSPSSGGTGTGTLPASGQLLIGNAGGTAYAPETVSGDGTLDHAGVLVVTKTNGITFALSATVDMHSFTNYG